MSSKECFGRNGNGTINKGYEMTTPQVRTVF